jgi:hypothetical protein
MRALLRLAGATIAALLVAVTAAGAASAGTARQGQPAGHAAPVVLRGGRTVVTTAPGIAAALLGSGIVPITTLPGTEGVLVTKAGPLVRLGFPVTGGRVSLNPLGGRIQHRGGILFLDVKTGKQIMVSDFTINLGSRVLTGIVNGNPHARVPVFRLGLAHSTLRVHRHWVTARGITARLTKVAASALDATFHTSLFKPGMLIGTAGTTLHI